MATPFPSPTKIWHHRSYPSISPSRPELSAKGKTILITGGGTGIGAETAHSFAQAGASRIALLGRRQQPLLETKSSIERQYSGIEVFTASADITNKIQVDAAFANFLHEGKLDVLVSNASMIGPQDPIKDVDPERFLDAIQMNLAGSLYISQAFLRHAAKDAVAIDVNSAVAHLNFDGGLASYGVSKLAIFRLWDFLAYESPDLSVFHIQPGLVDTDMSREAGGPTEAGFADDVSLPASFNVWLASPEAKFLKGKYLWTNWDVDELITRANEIEESTQLSIGLNGWPFGGK